MAKKRVHEIAKAQGLTAKELLAKLHAAGIEAKAASSTVEEDAALAAPGQRRRRATAATAPAAAAEPARAAARGGAAARREPRRRRAGAAPRRSRSQARPARRRGARRRCASPSEPRRGRARRRGRALAPDARLAHRRAAPRRVGPGGRRRVVIDSQASRRQAGGPAQQPVRRPPRRGRRRRGTYDDTVAPIDEAARGATDLIRINSGSTVKDVAEYFGVAVPEVIRKLMSLGEMATLTQTLTDEAIGVLAAEFDKEIEIVHAADDVDGEPDFEDADEDAAAAPAGRHDHGPRRPRQDLAARRDPRDRGRSGEAGGITQHIGAYQVRHGDAAITFLDTPGHEAFTAMRARGARVTDIAVIVVAADDGVKPQTDEAIDHARAADVPIIVAVNKIDKEGADPTRVRTEMTQRGLQPAEWGGDVEFVDVSARTKEGLDDLLETIQVVAELEELRSNPAAEASGAVIESRLDPGRGPVVTLLVQRGTLRVGDALVAGAQLRPRARDARLPRRARKSAARRASRSRCSASTACPRPASTRASSRTSAARASSPASAPTA